MVTTVVYAAAKSVSSVVKSNSLPNRVGLFFGLLGLHITLLVTGIMYGKIHGAPRDEDIFQARDDATAWCMNNATGIVNPSALCPALANAMAIYVNLDNCVPLCQHVQVSTLEFLCISGCKSAWFRVIEIANKTVDYHYRLAITGTFYFSAIVVGLFWLCVVVTTLRICVKVHSIAPPINNEPVELSRIQVEGR